MPRPTRTLEKIISWSLLGLALLIAARTTFDQWSRVGQPHPGFGVMENLLVGIGGWERAGLKPFDVVRALNGKLLASGREIQAEVARHPPGTTFRYLLVRRGELVEAEVATERTTHAMFRRYLLEGLLPGLLLLALGATVITLRPGAAETRGFLAFCLIWFVTHAAYNDTLTTYRFTRLFLAAWAFSPAVFVHLALRFPEPLMIARRYPRIVWLPYLVSAVMALLVQGRMHIYHPDYGPLVPTIAAVHWVAALILLILSLARTSFAGATALIRQRARVLMAGLAVGYLLPVLGTTVEAVFRVEVSNLSDLWRLAVLFPVAVAFAMVRYNLFDLRAVVRLGTIYSVVTGLGVLAYAVALTRLNVFFAQLGLEFAMSPMVSAGIVSLAVVLLLNPVYARTQALVDRVFFRQRYDARQAVERLSDAMTTVLDLNRIVEQITQTVNEVFHPARVTLLIAEDGRREPRPADAAHRLATIAEDSPLGRCCTERRLPLTREGLSEDPRLAEFAPASTRQMDALGADLVIPVLFRDRVTALLTLGPKRSGAAYTTDDLRLLRLLANQSAVALENAKAYSALQAALRRVEILESIRASLSKFVPKAVQDLIEQAPHAPELAKRDVDVSVLFVDIVGYTRLSQRLDAAQVNLLVERYFGAFLDEILREGGDVNETAGDGLMVIFQDADPRRHARAAVRTALAIVRRARQINAEPAEAAEPITLHAGVNSGVAAVGATKIEGTAGTRWTYTASGPVTNVAARLAALAQGDAILIGAETRRRLDGGFDLEDLGEQPLKNVEEPVRVFRLSLPDAPSPISPPPSPYLSPAGR
ncbi:MAG: GAF domain-containing protein [Candidatus Rokubacteria bacterium]|nr:GAF domain-containing protein [Candidatus Rokubacteria bacterium]